jgi:hypothetical protein
MVGGVRLTRPGGWVIVGVHDGTRIGMGGTLFGIGFGATLALLIYASGLSRSEKGGSAWGETWYIGFFAFAIVVALVGVYFLFAVWSGFQTGSTAIERAFQPRLVDTTAEAHLLVPPDYVAVKIGTINAGRGNVDEALVNVLVPEFITLIDRCDELGGRGHMGSFSHTTEALIPYQPNLGSIYWNGNVSFPGPHSPNYILPAQDAGDAARLPAPAQDHFPRTP